MINKKSSKKQSNIDEEIKKLVIERVKAGSENLKISVGDKGEYTKEDIIKSIEQNEEIGKKIIDSQMEFLRDLASGKIYQDE